MKEGTENNVKFKKLKRRLKLAEWQVIGLLESIWKLARISAPAGDIGRFSNEDIAASIEYEENADELVSVMVDCGWLDEDSEFRLVIHDWSEHVPNYLKGNFAKHKRSFADQVVKQRAKQVTKQTAKQTAKQCATKPSLVKPNQTIPSQAKSTFAPTAKICWSVLEGWQGINPTDFDRWKNAYPACNIELQLAQMTEWLIANPEKATKSRWSRFITNWLKRAQDRGGDVQSNRPVSKTQTAAERFLAKHANQTKEVDDVPKIS